MTGAAWYAAEDKRKSVRQVVVETTDPGPVASRFGRLVLGAEHRTLMASFWAIGFFRRDGDPGPTLLLRADGQTTRLKSRPFRVAFSFYRMKAGGLMGVFVDFPGLHVPRAPSAPFVLFETIRGLDLEDVRGRIGEAIDQPRLHICFAEGEGPGDDLGSGLVAGGGVDALYDVLMDIDPRCRDSLNDEWTALLAYHDSLSAGTRDFPASVRQMQSENPLTVNPIIDRA